MRLNKVSTLIATAVLATLSAAPALANQAGDIVVRAGLTKINPSSEQSTIYALNKTVDLGAGAITASTEDDSQLGLNFVYFVTDNLAIELLAATPFSHDITVNTGAGAVNLGETKHLPPTLSALYYFNDAAAKFQPYIGLGINYTVFFEEKFNPALTGDSSPEIVKLGGEDFGPAPINLTNLKLKNSWGLSAQVGADYKLDDQWLVNASARYIDIDTTATFNAVNDEVTGQVDVSIDPWVYTISIGYTF